MPTLNIVTSTLPGNCATGGYSTHIAGNGTVFVVMPDNGSTYYRSGDGGATWTSYTHPLPAGQRYHNAVAWNGSYFLVVYNTRWAKSTDGITWTNGTIAGGSSHSMLAWSGTRWVLGMTAYNTNQQLWSTDGENWNAVTVLGVNWLCTDVIWDGARFCMDVEQQFATPYDNYFMTSPDGVTWTQRGKMNVSSGDGADRMFYNGALYLVINRYPNPAFSPDGITWSNSTTSGGVIGTCGSDFVSQDTASTFSTSTDATVFTSIPVNLGGTGASGFFWDWKPCQYAPGKFACIGNSNKFATFEVISAIPPFWTSLTGTREAV
ncbi:hypothetical protein [Variovorax sp. AFSI2.2]|uniref:hypothetical protein n=1 Tax=Variovorax sp. AFSI2.2 TaxID=3384160 RepID=UPI003EBF7501